MSDTRVLLLCGNRFALQMMQELAFFNQLAAVAIPAHCDEWQEHAAAALQGFSIPVILLQKETYAAQLKAAFAEYRADIGLMATFSFRIPPEIFALPKGGFFNVHPGPLPAYRGPDPVFYQIRNREKFAEVTLHRVDAGWDTGPIVMRERIGLLPSDTHGLLSYRLSLAAARLVQNLIKLSSFGLSLPEKAQDVTGAAYQKRQTAAEVSIAWESSGAADIVALINACNPWNKGASTRLGQRIIRITEAAVMPGSINAPAGTILGFQNADMLVACAGGEILALRIVSLDEGIMTAGRLTELGINAGQQFQSII